MTEPSREQLLIEGQKQARIYGVDPECAGVYAEGWAAAWARADRAVDEMQREISKVTWDANFNAELAVKQRIEGLERQLRCVQLYGYGYLLKHGKDQIALDPKDVTVVLPSTRHMDDFDLHNSLYLTEQQVQVLEERIRKAKAVMEITEDREIPSICWQIAKEVRAALDGEDEETP